MLSTHAAQALAPSGHDAHEADDPNAGSGRRDYTSHMAKHTRVLFSILRSAL